MLFLGHELQRNDHLEVVGPTLVGLLLGPNRESDHQTLTGVDHIRVVGEVGDVLHRLAIDGVPVVPAERQRGPVGGGHRGDLVDQCLASVGVLSRHVARDSLIGTSRMNTLAISPVASASAFSITSNVPS